MADLPEVTSDTFDSEVKQAESPVLVDFGADWCKPCKQLDPIVEELAGEWEGKVKVVHVDVDVNGETAMKFGVMGVPTLIMFVDGEPQERLTGFVPKQKIQEAFSAHIPA